MHKLKEASPPPQASILAVDDHRDSLRLLVRLLSDQGFRVRPAVDGESALAAAAADPPDLVLLDVQLPEMDGYEVCRRLKAGESTARVPVVFLSAANETINKDLAIAAGGVDFVTKPYKAEEILARVDTQIRLHRLQAQVDAQDRALQAEIALRRRTEAALLELNERLEALVAQRPDYPPGAAKEPETEAAGRLRVRAAFGGDGRKHRLFARRRWKILPRASERKRSCRNR